MKQFSWVAVFGAFLLPAPFLQAQVTITPGPETSLPVVIPATSPSAGANFSLKATDNGTIPEPEPYNPAPVQWSWTATVTSGPAGAVFYVMPETGSDTVTVSLYDLFGPGHWQVNVTATVTYNSGPNQVVRQGNLMVDVYAVGVDRIQFQLPGGSFQEMPGEGLYVKAGTSVTFKALRTPADAPNWPAGKPVWGGSCGATGTGDTVTVGLNSPSYDINDKQDIFAECGNMVSHMIVRYGEDEATFDILLHETIEGLAVARATYKFWVPDDNGDGSPDAPEGYAVIRTLDFQSSEDLPPLIEQGRWPFSNGETYFQELMLFQGEPLTTDESPIEMDATEGYPEPSGYGMLPRLRLPALAHHRPPREKLPTLMSFLKAHRTDPLHTLYQDPPQNPVPIGQLLKLIPNFNIPAQITEVVIQELRDYYKKIKVGVKPAEEVETPKVLIVGTQIQVGMKHTTRATQRAFLAEVGVKYGLSLYSDVKADTATFKKGPIDFFSVPAVVTGAPDFSNHFRLRDGPKWPNAGAAQTGAIVSNAPPGIYFRKPALGFRNGFSYGTVNYSTAKLEVLSPYAVTNAIYTVSGAPARYALKDAEDRQWIEWCNGPQDNGGQLVEQWQDTNGFWRWARVRYVLKPGWADDLLKDTQQIQWK